MKRFKLLFVILCLLLVPTMTMGAYPTTTTHSKLYPKTSVLASPYNCDNTGTLDCSAAIEQIKANQVNIGTIYFPHGTYRISSNLTIPDTMCIEREAGAIFSVDAGKVLTINAQIIGCPGQLFSGSGSVVFGSDYVGCEVIDTWFPTLAKAVASIGANDYTLRVCNCWSLTSNLEIPSNVTIKIENGAILSIADGVTLTINGFLDAELYQIFDDNNTNLDGISFGDGSVKEVYPEWWGAVGDGTTDDTDALKAAILAAGDNRVYFTASCHLVSDAITINGSIQNPYLHSCSGTWIKRSTSGQIFHLKDESGGSETKMTHVVIDGLKFDGVDSSTDITAVYMENSFRPLVKNCYFKNLKNAIYAEKASWPHIENNTFNICTHAFAAPLTGSDSDIRIGDLVFINNTFWHGTDGSVAIQAAYIDGLNCQGNIFAGASFSMGERRTDKHIYITAHLHLARIIGNAFWCTGGDKTASAYGHAISIRGSYMVRIIGNEFYNIGNKWYGSAVFVDNRDFNVGYGADLPALVIQGNVIKEPTCHALWLLGVRKCIVDGNTIIDANKIWDPAYQNGGSSKHGVMIDGDSASDDKKSRDVVVANNVIVETRSGATDRMKYGVYLGYCVDDIVITGNAIRGSYIGDPIYIAPTDAIPQLTLDTNHVTAWSPCIAQTADFDVKYSMANRTFTNKDATGVITASLPYTRPGMKFTFIRVASHAFRIDPYSSQQIRGGSGGGKYISLDSDGALVTLQCVTTGYWERVTENGTISNEP